ncbi:TetR family transcriptional regulator [Salicola sp. Rm-C-2C1-2]|uniref:TetR family transcriptional regulator n=1 Tax=Salicola sp. Rm-C-2C1-2 TaxID=3141321 RepID=UPI0032E4740A
MKLLQASLRLVTSSRSISSLGIRELAREAGLNPNTFYRHFSDLDDFGLFVLECIASEVKHQVRRLRTAAATSDQAAHESVYFVYEYFRTNPAVVMVAVRELHGPSLVLRQALARQLEEAASEMADDVTERALVPQVSRTTVLDIARTMVRFMLFRGMDYIEHPEQQKAIQQETERFLRRQFMGAMAETLVPGLDARLKGD